MTKSYFESIKLTEDEKRRYIIEALIIDFEEYICSFMEENNISEEELCKRLKRIEGKYWNDKSGILDGNRSWTLREIVDVCFVLGLAPKLSFINKEEIEK